MKKVLLAFAILGFVACNNEGEKAATTDTPAVATPAVDSPAVDTPAVAAPAVDSPKVDSPAVAK